MRARWPLFIWLVLAIGCGGLMMPLQRQDCPVEPVARATLPKNLSFRARMRLGIGKEEVSLEVIARSTPEELVVVGIAPFGMRLFELRQRDQRFMVDSSASAEASGLALYAADALTRAYWIQPPANSYTWDRNGEQITDSLRDGERRRIYRRLGQPTGSHEITIDYAGATGPGTAPDARIENPWCGYRAMIVPFKANHRSSGS